LTAAVPDFVHGGLFFGALVRERSIGRQAPCAAQKKPMASGLYALSAFLVIALRDPKGLRGYSPARAAD